MKVYRITQAAYATDLSGNGAKLHGGRWNSPGNFALYAAQNRALALIEVLVHTPFKFLLSKEYRLIELEIPDVVEIKILNESNMPNQWDAWMPTPVTRALGDTFLNEMNGLVLRVPSVLLPEENIFIINPLLPNIKWIKLKSNRLLTFNDRLLKTLQ